jgi:hypothetical protein
MIQLTVELLWTKPAGPAAGPAAGAGGMSMSMMSSGAGGGFGSTTPRGHDFRGGQVGDAGYWPLLTLGAGGTHAKVSEGCVCD